MSDVVVDSTVLIYLAKLGQLERLQELFNRVFVPEAVYTEVVEEGHEAGYGDAFAVEAAIEDFCQVIPVPSELTQAIEQFQETAGLGQGEAVAIGLAREHDARCLSDDHAARSTAESVGVDVGGTIFVLLEALSKGDLTVDEYVAQIDELADSGFRMDASLYRRALEAGTEIDPD